MPTFRSLCALSIGVHISSTRGCSMPTFRRFCALSIGVHISPALVAATNAQTPQCIQVMILALHELPPLGSACLRGERTRLFWTGTAFLRNAGGIKEASSRGGLFFMIEEASSRDESAVGQMQRTIQRHVPAAGMAKKRHAIRNQRSTSLIDLEY